MQEGGGDLEKKGERSARFWKDMVVKSLKPEGGEWLRQGTKQGCICEKKKISAVSQITHSNT